MLKRRKKLMAQMLVLMMCTSVVPTTMAFAADTSSQAASQSVTPESDFTFDASTGTITQYNGNDTTLTIPSTIGGVLVTKIGEKLFQGCSNLTDVTIPNSVKSIGDSAFYLCTSLKSIVIPDSVVNIGKSTFMNCTNLTSAKISNGMTSIPWQTFKSCTSLTSVTIPNSVTNIQGEAFRDCSSLKDIVIPDSVIIIKDWAFYGCASLENMIIPNGVARIGLHTFDSCSSLTSITIPDTVIGIDDYAFARCTGLKSVTIPDSVTGMGYAPFDSSNNAVFYVNSQEEKNIILNADHMYSSQDIAPSRIIVSGKYAVVKVKSIDLNVKNLYLTVGKTQTFMPTVLPSDASNKGLIWETDNPGVAMVDVNGNITGIGVGTAKITCTSKDGGKVSTECSVTVTKGTVQIIKPTSISLSTTTSNWTIGKTGTFTASLLPSNATDNTVTWTSSDTNIATVSSSGVVTPKASGTVIITATSNGDNSIKASKTITISGQSSSTTATDTKVTGITISGSDSITTKGGTLTLTPNILPSVATNKTVTWKASDASIATVDSQGVVTAKANGTVTITATANDGSNVTGTKVITITGQPGSTTTADIKITGITINGNSSIATQGGTATLTTSILPSNAANQAVTWTSSNPSIATVNSSGVVTAISNGSVAITATTADGSNVSAAKVITVTGQSTTSNSTSDSLLKSVNISGTEEVGDKLRAKVTYSGTKPSLEYQWQRASKKDGDYTDISGADEEEYRLKSSDKNKYIKVIVTATINGTNHTVEDKTSKIDRNTSEDDDSDSSSHSHSNSGSGSYSSTNSNDSYNDTDNVVVLRSSTVNDSSSQSTSNSVLISPTVGFTNPAGHLMNGWVNASNKWYYLDKDGRAKVGWILYNSKWYYLDQSGVMLSNTTIDGYTLGADGAMI